MEDRRRDQNHANEIAQVQTIEVGLERTLDSFAGTTTLLSKRKVWCHSHSSLRVLGICLCYSVGLYVVLVCMNKVLVAS